jgi:plastocyanin
MSLRTALATLATSIALGAVIVSAAQHAVSQKGKVFSTAAITVKPGDEIVFKNDDDVTHNLFTNTPGLEFNLTQPPGGQTGHVFKTEGVADVRCAFHPRMKLTVTVAK